MILWRWSPAKLSQSTYGAKLDKQEDVHGENLVILLDTGSTPVRSIILIKRFKIMEEKLNLPFAVIVAILACVLLKYGYVDEFATEICKSTNLDVTCTSCVLTFMFKAYIVVVSIVTVITIVVKVVKCVIKFSKRIKSKNK